MKKEYRSFVLLILFGLAISLGVLTKVSGVFYIDSDWFWFFAGVGLAVEGFISLRRQMEFDRKYKIIKRGI